VHYGAVQALKGVSLHVQTGEVVTIIGGNGAGKSTLMKAVSGLEPAASGSIAFRGRNITGVPGHLRVPLGIAQSPEGRQVFADQTVLDNLVLGAYHRNASSAELEADVDEQFALFPRLRERQQQMAGTMSGGEQQMLAIARALMAKPHLLLLDEPSMGLSPVLVRGIFKIIQDINRAGKTILLVEQNANMSLSIAHRGYVLETGRIVLSGTGEELTGNPRVKEAYLGG
jgi:branched-chain amino acid transport system ATP-binding protein